MKIKKLVSLLLMFVLCLSITTFVSAEDNSSEKFATEKFDINNATIRVVDHETYIKEVAEFNELIKNRKNEDKITDDMIFLSPKEFEKRLADYQAVKSTKAVPATKTGYGGLGGYLSGDYFHVLTSYSPSTAYFSYYYKYLGYVRFVNTGSSAGELSYVQVSTVTATASLSVSSTLSASVKADMLGFAEVEAGVSCTLGSTITAGTSFATQAGGTVTVPAGETRRITAYNDGVYVGGTAYYNIYDESNGYPGILYEVNDARPASDEVVITNGISLVVAEY